MGIPLTLGDEPKNAKQHNRRRGERKRNSLTSYKPYEKEKGGKRQKATRQIQKQQIEEEKGRTDKDNHVDQLNTTRTMYLYATRQSIC